MADESRGPLAGVRIVEFAGIGPGPYAGMLFADMGADVVRVDRMAGPARSAGAERDLTNRGKRSIGLDLKSDGGLEAARRLVAAADGLIEGFRPGVMERLGLGPEVCTAANPRLVYGRMTGWGQDGPLAHRAGHDINYISVTGALWAVGRPPDRPVPPMNLLGDYGGGSLFLVMGMLAALYAARDSGRGQVVDAAIVDGVASLTTPLHALRAAGTWSDDRGLNLLDSGAPNYEVYECGDGRFVSIGALEPQFYAELVRRTGFRDGDGDGDTDRYRRDGRSDWPAAKLEWAALFKTRTRDEWVALTADSDACLAPVLDWDEALEYEPNVARSVYLESDGVVQPAPAPRLSRDRLAIGGPPPLPGQDTDVVLSEAGYSDSEIADLRGLGAIG